MDGLLDNLLYNTLNVKKKKKITFSQNHHNQALSKCCSSFDEAGHTDSRYIGV